MERTFYTKKTTNAQELQLPDDILSHIRTFIPCKDIMHAIHFKKMARFVASRSDAWILAHIPLFETIHRRNFTEFIKICRKEGLTICLAWFQDNICRIKKGRKYITTNRANGISKRMLLAEAVKHLRRTAFDDYTHRMMSKSLIRLQCAM